jgi:predicted dehydrogenase
MNGRVIGIGVVGMGWMGETHSRSYLAVRDRFHDSGVTARLVACADVDGARAQAAARRYGFERATTDWHDVVDDPDVEAVSVCTPNDLHVPVVKAAVERGKPVLCEKPVGQTPEETLEAAEAARRAGVVSLVGYNYRWAPVVQHAHELIAAGELGDITHYRGRFLNGYARDPGAPLTWRFLIEHGTGTLADLLSHVIDMAHFMCGPIAELVADRATFITRRPIPGAPEGTTGEVTNEDTVAALVRFRNGVQGSLEACRIITGPKAEMAFEIYGTKGAIRWSLERMNELRFLRRNDAAPAEEGWADELSGPPHPFHRSFNPGWGLALGYDDLKVIEAGRFLHAIASGTPGSPNLDDAAAVARVQQAIIASWASGRWETVARQ